MRKMQALTTLKSQVTFAVSVIKVKFMLQKEIFSIYYLTKAPYLSIIRGWCRKSIYAHTTGVVGLTPLL